MLEIAEIRRLIHAKLKEHRGSTDPYLKGKASAFRYALYLVDQANCQDVDVSISLKFKAGTVIKVLDHSNLTS